MKVKRLLILLAVILLLIILPLISYYFLKQGEHVRTLRRVPAFSFATIQGDTLSTEDLSGNVYVANFIYTRCPIICDTLNRNLSALQNSFKNRNDLKIVTFTIDPEYDTPEVMREYAQQYDPNEGQWYFITADREKVYDLILGGFFGKVSYSDGTPNKMKADEKVVLIDREGYIKGYYEDDELPELTEAVKALLNTDQ